MPYTPKQCELFRMMEAGMAEGTPPKDWRKHCKDVPSPRKGKKRGKKKA